MAEPTVRLTSEQIGFYHEQGYLALPPITTAEELVMLRATYDRLFAIRAGHAEGNHFDLAGANDEAGQLALPQILGPSKYAPELATSLLRANCDVIAAQLGGPECVYRGDHAINKPARSGAATPWHQDEAYWGDDQVFEQALSIWVPFQDVDERNGCMQFIPGSQRLDVMPHHTINNDPKIHGLELDAGKADVSRPAVCPLKAGGCTIHPSRTLHFTAANRSEAPRRAYILVYHTPAKKLAVGRNFYWNHSKQTGRDERAKAAAAQKAAGTAAP